VPHGERAGAVGAEAFNTRSIRKSLLRALYGLHVDAGHLRLAQTLDELGINDQNPTLTANEKQATEAGPLTSRSGVYHASNGQGQTERDNVPPRGSHAPGTCWHGMAPTGMSTPWTRSSSTVPARVASMSSSDGSRIPCRWRTSMPAWG